MSPRTALLLLLASSCGGTAIAYEADCGLLVEEGPSTPPLANTVACQRAAVKHGLVTCPLMQGVHVQFLPAESWKYGEVTVRGLNYCPGDHSFFESYGFIQVSNAPVAEGSLIHELRHLQDCGKGLKDPHAGWIDAGVYESIVDAKLEAQP